MTGTRGVAKLEYRASGHVFQPTRSERKPSRPFGALNYAAGTSRRNI